MYCHSVDKFLSHYLQLLLPSRWLFFNETALNIDRFTLESSSVMEMGIPSKSILKYIIFINYIMKKYCFQVISSKF
jgi:hypothetical protein